MSRTSTELQRIDVPERVRSDQGLGAWFRLGNRVNEGTPRCRFACTCPTGGWVHVRSTQDRDERRDEGRWPRDRRRDTVRASDGRYDGKVVVLDEPEQMTNPREAFRDNPMVACRVRLDVHGVSPMYGGKPQYADGTEIEDRRAELVRQSPLRAAHTRHGHDRTRSVMPPRCGR
jgi:hypothetical protein